MLQRDDVIEDSLMVQFCIVRKTILQTGIITANSIDVFYVDEEENGFQDRTLGTPLITTIIELSKCPVQTKAVIQMLRWKYNTNQSKL